MKKQERIDYESRLDRLKRIADTIKKEGTGTLFDGADYKLAFHYLFNEMLILQSEFYQRFSDTFDARPELKEYTQRMVQLFETVDSILLDSISPAKNNQKAAAQRAKLKPFPPNADEKTVPKSKTASTPKKNVKGTGDKKKPKT